MTKLVSDNDERESCYIIRVLPIKIELSDLREKRGATLSHNDFRHHLGFHSTYIIYIPLN